MTDALLAQLQAALAGAYVIERELGGGGMSRVFVARETALGRAVVVKVLTPALAAGVSADRFAREVRLAARLQHPNIVPVLTAGEMNGLPWYTMPFVRGESLRARMATGASAAVGEAAGVLRDVARALACAHGEGVVHRDIKPENVLLSGGVAMVADFGIAKAVSDARTVDGSEGGATTLTQAGMSLGTPAYMAPEQATGDGSLDHRADLYAWGVMAWELLAGQHPFAGRASTAALIAAHIAEAPPELASRRPDVPTPLAGVVMRCLAKDPAQRPQTAQEVLAALDGVTMPRATMPVETAWSRRRAPALLVGTALALLGGAGTWALLHRLPTGPSGAGAPRSLAVLPFHTVGRDTADAYYAEGISEELTTALSRVPELRLAGRRSAARFSGQTSTVQEIGKALNVGAVLEGTVRRADERIRVSAELTSASDGLVLWSESYERPAREVFALQDDITQAIVGALSLRLAASGTGASSAASHRPTGDLQAYDLYLRGLHLLRHRGPGVARARDFFEQAIARDGGFALAHAALAATLLTMPYFLPVRMGEVLPPARAAAEKALRLGDGRPESHVAMGYVHAESFEWPAAEAEFRRAIALDSTDTEARYRLGNLLMLTGRTGEAVTELEKAKARDPMYPIAMSYLAWTYLLAGRVDDAIAEARRALELEPRGLAQHTILASLFNLTGHPAEAVDLARHALQLTDAPARVGTMAKILAENGQRAEAAALVRRLEATPPGTWGRESGLSFGYLGLGETDKALATMQRAAAGDGDLFYAYLGRAVRGMDRLRDDPRMVAVLARYNLSPDILIQPGSR